MLKINKPGVVDMIKSLQSDAENLIENLMQLLYFMRGSISYSEIMNMTLAERQIMQNFIEKRLKDESKNPYPVY